MQFLQIDKLVLANKNWSSYEMISVT